MEIPQPKHDYDWNTYSSKKNQVAGHVESKWTAETGWSAPRFVKDPYLLVHGLAPGLHYGQQVYEGLQARRTSNNDILIFRPAAHAARMALSSQALCMPPIPPSFFLTCVHMLVALNASYVPPFTHPGSLYIRPVQFGSSCQIGLEPPDEFTFCVFAQPHLAFHGEGVTLRALIAEDFDRAATRGMGHVKVGGNYAPVMLRSRKAKEEGYNVLLHVDSATQTCVDEFSTSGFVGVKKQGGRVTVVLAESAAAIQSVTGDCVAQLARKIGWEVERRTVGVDELGEFEEVIAVGTAAGLVSVTSIFCKSTGREVRYGEGECRGRLAGMLGRIQRGEEDDEFGWCDKLDWGRWREYLEK